MSYTKHVNVKSLKAIVSSVDRASASFIPPLLRWGDGMTANGRRCVAVRSRPQRVGLRRSAVARGGWRGWGRFVRGRVCLRGCLDYGGFGLILIG